MTQNNPIGIFDSGIGGLSIACKIRDALPNEDILYIADSLHAPYGNKTPEFITQRSITLTRFLIENGAKAIVVACNTATVSSIHQLRAEFSLPIIGVEPGVKPAAENSKTGVIGILATERTLESESFLMLSDRFSRTVKVEIQPCPGLVEQVEKLDLNSEYTRKLVYQYVQALLNKGVDTIVLGCTHYPFLIPLILEITGEDISVIDTSFAVTKEVKRRLSSQNMLSNSAINGTEYFYTSGNSDKVKEAINKLWGSPVKVSLLPHIDDYDYVSIANSSSFSK